MDESLSLSVSQFVEVFNQTLEMAWPSVSITGELANFRISKNKWVYFDLKDESCSVKFFGTVYQLPGPLEDGMLIKVRGQPKLHKLYGFSVNIFSMQPAGEGSIKKAANLLQAKLSSEGLFDESRKRSLPYPPQRIGLITSTQSAAYADFLKVIKARWQGLSIEVIDVQVQGEIAPSQIVNAINQFNSEAEPVEVLVLCRGGGSAEDLAAYSTESVTRSVASSRVPTLVAIGHEIDISLAELAADLRGSTPSNAAELLVPDRNNVSLELKALHKSLDKDIEQLFANVKYSLGVSSKDLSEEVQDNISKAKLKLHNQLSLIEAYNPTAILKRGYAIVRHEKGDIVKSVKSLKTGEDVTVKIFKGEFKASVKGISE
jgi:exodeoxyribonuclease VII large subunit